MKKKLETRDMLFLLYFRKSPGGTRQVTSRESTFQESATSSGTQKETRCSNNPEKKGVQTMAMIFQPKKEVLTDSTPFCFTKHTRRKKHAASVPCNIFIHL